MLKQLSSPIISIVVPLYNEEEVIGQFIDRIDKVIKDVKYNTELIFINDGSSDNSLNILRELAAKNKYIKIISFSRNFGHQMAITAGMNFAQGDAAIIMDGDLQDPPELIPQMLQYWEKGYEVVYAQRMKRKGENWFKLVTASLFYKVFDCLTRMNVPLDTGDFRLIDKKVLAVYNNLSEKNPFIRGLITWIGFKQIGIAYDRDVRYAGNTKFGLYKMLKFALDGIISFSNSPLKFALNVGGLSVLLSMGLIAYFLYLKVTNLASLVQGWLSLFIVVSFFSGVQLFTIGIIGEYVARIYDEVKNRPRYIIEEKIGF